MLAAVVQHELLSLGDSDKARDLHSFFKTGPGQYGEGDVFCGVSSPHVRSVAKKYRDLPLEEIEKLLQDRVHEVRACALVLLTQRFPKGNERERRSIVEIYLRNSAYINNWDLVDISCAILGQWVMNGKRDLLYKLAVSPLTWEQRMAVVATLPLIKKGDFKDTLALVRQLLHHPHHLMHKAMGWMLREVGKKNRDVLENFLDEHVLDLPRTTLRYAIERFEPQARKAWLRR